MAKLYYGNTEGYNYSIQTEQTLIFVVYNFNLFLYFLHMGEGVFSSYLLYYVLYLCTCAAI